MLAHGYHHARSLDGTTKWFRSKGFRRPGLVALGSAGGELAIGAGLMAGLLTSLAAGGLVVVTTIAFWTIHRFAGFFVFGRPDEGWEYVGTLSVAALAIAVLGPGTISLDHLFGWTDALSGATGWWAVAGGVVLGVVVLSLLWRRPQE